MRWGRDSMWAVDLSNQRSWLKEELCWGGVVLVRKQLVSCGSKVVSKFGQKNEICPAARHVSSPKLLSSREFEMLNLRRRKNMICTSTVGCGTERSDGEGWCVIWKDAQLVMVGNSLGWFKCGPSDLGMDGRDLKRGNRGKGEKWKGGENESRWI